MVLVLHALIYPAPPFFSLINLLSGKDAGAGTNADLRFLTCITQAQKFESAAPVDTTKII